MTTLTWKYPVPFGPGRISPCLCERGGIEEIPLTFIGKCNVCFRRFHVEKNEDGSEEQWLLLLPWKGFNTPKVTGTQPCPVCHGFTDFNAPEARYTCEESLCGYSWYQKNMGIPRSVRRLMNEKEQILEEWTTSPGAKKEGAIIVRIGTIQEEISVLESSYWVTRGIC